MKRKLQLTCLFLMSLFGVINATNITVNANISSNTTWSVDTVYIDADIAIDSGFVLTINPGTVILFNDFYQIQVYGLIISFGTELDPIIYTVEDTTGFSTFSHTGWNGFLFDNSANDCQQDTSVFVYSEFYYAIETLEWYGGATFIIKNFSKIVFDHCTFMYNYSTQMGGALGIQDNSSPIIVNSVFEYNFSDYGGGAVNIGCESAGDTLCPYFENNIFRYNQCLYTGTYYGGGAIKISAHSQAIFINNIITDNSCPIGTGGGGIVISGYSSPILINNLIANNYASATGGGIMIRYNANPVLINNTIVNNSADGDGGGIGNGCSTDSLRMYNNIVYGNTAAGAGNQVFINNDDDCIEYEFANNLFEGGTAAFGLGDTSVFAPLYMNNIDDDPLFIDAANGDFRLEPCSPAINSGLNAAVMVSMDMDHMPRIFETIVDLGVYEHQLEQFITINDTAYICLGDSIYLEGAWQTGSAVYTDYFGSPVLYCDSTVYTYLIVNNLPVVDLGADQTIYDNETTTLDAGTFISYLWNDMSTGQTLVVDGAVLGLGNYDFSLTVVDANGCSNSDTINVTVEEYIGVAENGSHNISIYPNPSDGLFVILSDCSYSEVVDIRGNIVETIQFNSNNKQNIDLRSYDKGIYFVRCYYNDNLITRKIVIN